MNIERIILGIGFCFISYIVGHIIGYKDGYENCFRDVMDEFERQKDKKKR